MANTYIETFKEVIKTVDGKVFPNIYSKLEYERIVRLETIGIYNKGTAERFYNKIQLGNNNG